MPHRTYVVTAQPASEPIALDELKRALRITVHEFDVELKREIKAAREQLEKDTQRRLVSQSVTMYLDRFSCRADEPDTIEIRQTPVTEVVSVKYYRDGSDTLETMPATEYHADVISTPARIVLRDGSYWPATDYDRPNAVEIAFVAGAANASAVPAEATTAIVEWVRAQRGCGEAMKAYHSLVSSLQWTAHHR